MLSCFPRLNILAVCLAGTLCALVMGGAAALPPVDAADGARIKEVGGLPANADPELQQMNR